MNMKFNAFKKAIKSSEQTNINISLRLMLPQMIWAQLSVPVQVQSSSRPQVVEVLILREQAGVEAE